MIEKKGSRVIYSDAVKKGKKAAIKVKMIKAVKDMTKKELEELVGMLLDAWGKKL